MEGRGNGAPGRDDEPARTGEHACTVYRTGDERLESLLPFLETGLRDDERTVCVVDGDALDPVRGALGSRGIDVPALEEEGALFFEDLSGYPVPGEFEPAVAVERLRRSARKARLDGFIGLRVAADMAWAADADPASLVEYEHLVDDRLFPGTRTVGLCLYPRDAFPRELLDEVIPAHRLLAARGELYPSPFFGFGPAATGETQPGVSDRLLWLRPHLRRASTVEEALRELERSGRDRDELLAMLAHELRNPLAGLSNAAALLEERSQREPKLVRIADVVARQTRHLSEMLDDVLELARLGRADVDLARTEVRLDEVVRRAARTLEGRFDAREVGLELELPLGLPGVRADASRLERAVVELLSNALAHTGRGGRVSVGVEVRDDEVELAVRDTGAGIPPDLLPRIFEPFVRGRLGRHDGGVGLGIGLTIVKRLVELQGGSVEAHSPGRGEGTQVVVRLPRLEEPSPSRPAADHEAGAYSSEEASAPPARVLIVEDDRDSAFLLRDLLEAWGHETRIAHDGASALREIERFDPAVVFLDLALPRMDGLEVARRIRSGEDGDSGPRPVLVAMTGYGRPSDRKRTREAGFAEHLVKPVSVRRVRDLLDGLDP